MADFQSLLNFWQHSKYLDEKSCDYLIANQLNFASVSKELSVQASEMLIWEYLKHHEDRIDSGKTASNEYDCTEGALTLSSCHKQDSKLWKSNLDLSALIGCLPDKVSSSVPTDADITLFAKGIRTSSPKSIPSSSNSVTGGSNCKGEIGATLELDRKDYGRNFIVSTNNLKRPVASPDYGEASKKPMKLTQSYANVMKQYLCGEPNISQNYNIPDSSLVSEKVIPDRKPSEVVTFKSAKQLFKDQQKRFPQPNSRSLFLTKNRPSHFSTKQNSNAVTLPPKKVSTGIEESENEEKMKHIDPKMVELMLSEIMDHGPPIMWDDIAGLEFAKTTIKEIVIWPMLRPDLFTGLRGPPKGVLLFGPPGTGKTLIGKCIASQTKSTFFSISASSLTSKWIGEGEKLVKALFAVARCHQPAVIFIDEIDSLLTQRSESEHESSRRIKTEFLVQLDGATTSSNERLLLVGATNRPQELDEAMRRRLVKRLYIPLPESDARGKIIKTLLRDHKHLLTAEDFNVICNKTDGYSGSDMANLCKEAALGPIRKLNFADIEHINEDQVEPIILQDFLDALKQSRSRLHSTLLQLHRQWDTCKKDVFLPRTAYQNSVPDINISWDFTTNKLPKHARVVICGGGVVGCSVAYHLVHDFGWKDVVLLEQGRLGGGTTWHGAGLLGQMKQTPIETKMCQYSINLYKDLQKRGLNTGWKECGSLLLARTRDRMIEFRRLAAAAKIMDVECELLTPEDARKHCPIISTQKLEGALWIPGDGVGDPVDTCLTLATEASKKGVTVIEGCAVNRIITNDQQCVSGIDTNKGLVNCEYFVNSAGVWARHIGEASHPQVKVPLYPCEHHFLHTLPVKDIDPMMPVIRDYDGYFYIRENNGRFLAGGFEPVSKPLDPKDLSDSFKPLPEDWDQFYILLEEMLFRIPSLGDVEIDRLCNGPESFTPDCKWILGEAPEVKNYFIASGMKSIGIEAAGGVGKVTAEWIFKGEPTIDVWDLDIKRFLGLHNNPLFLRDRMREIPGLHYILQYPFREFETGRCLRMSPIYPRLKDAGAVFGQTMGYERPSYFDPELKDEPDIQEGGRRIARTRTFGIPPWFELVKSEYEACRERVALLDYSSFTKLELWSPGREVVDVLQYLCSNDVDIPIGSIIHTGMQNKLGGYENDCSLIRLAENHYMMIAPTNQQTRCQHWIKRHLPPDTTVSVTDVTSMYTAICLMGPRSRNVLSELTDCGLTPQAFPFFSYKELNIGLANGVRAMNLTHTGELGYVLYIPNEYALHVYDCLLEAGQSHGIQHAGLYAMRTLRIEKFYAFWGQDLDTTTTPLECGRAFRVKFDKGDFIGKEALLHQKEEGVKRYYVQLVLEDHNPDLDLWPWGREPIYLDDACVGMTTTTGYGFTLGNHVCLGFIQMLGETGTPQVISTDYILKNTFEIDIAGKRYPAKANLHSPKLTFVDHGYLSGYMATR